MEWDFFISHASEDKADVARPLAQELMRAGFRVWLDVFELRIGDDIRAKIDEGLARSAFGIVILSNAFFEKRWTSAELGGLFALEQPGKTRILPIWHKLDEATVARYSPLLASRVGAPTTLSAFTLAQRIINDLGDRLDSSRAPHARLSKLLASASKPELIEFLAAHPFQLAYATRLIGSPLLEMTVRPVLRPPPNNRPDLILAMQIVPTGYGTSHVALALGPTDLSSASGEAWLADVRTLAADLKDAADSIKSKHPKDSVTSVIAAGRRRDLSDSQREAFTLIPPRTAMRTYDWLVDAFFHSGPQPKGFHASVGFDERHRGL